MADGTAGLGDESKANKNSDFSSAKLQLDQPVVSPDDSQMFQVGTDGFNRQTRPGSTMSQSSTTSTGSKISTKPGKKLSSAAGRTYFSKRKGALENAVEDIKIKVNQEDFDGELRGAWLLTEIDHWDNNCEKVFLLTDNSLLICKYDFITLKLYEYKRVMLHIIDTVMAGELVYPYRSLMKYSPRKQGGVRLHWDNNAGATFGQRWNPFSKTIPWVTVTFHPLVYDPEENESVSYNVEDFYDTLMQVLTAAYEAKNPGKQLQVLEGPIEIKSYANLASVIYNQGWLGFNRDRHGVSF